MDLRVPIEAIRPSVVQITVTADGLTEADIAALGGHGKIFVAELPPAPDDQRECRFGAQQLTDAVRRDLGDPQAERG